MKNSPLCSRKDGREIYFTVKTDTGAKLRVTFPKDDLDAALGATATEKSRKAWVTDQMPATLTMIAQHTAGGIAPSPLLTPEIEEIS